MSTNDTILEHAEALTQTVGYGGFSYRDLAARVGIRAASIHHHFPAKADLCLALVARHRERMRGFMAEIDARPLGPVAKLKKYVALFQETIADGNRMCLCGMLASDVEGLPPSARDALRAAFVDHEDWLAKVLEAGRDSGVIPILGKPLDEARSLLAGLEGALLIARTFGDSKRFATISRAILRGLIRQA